MLTRQSSATKMKEDDDDETPSPPAQETTERNVIVRGSEGDTFTDEIWEEIDSGEPPKWMVLKELMGINIFTYILAALIVISFSLNVLLGPGWLGQAIGMKGVGTFTAPDPVVDLSNSDYLL